jgi:hypothetical protein
MGNPPPGLLGNPLLCELVVGAAGLQGKDVVVVEGGATD